MCIINEPAKVSKTQLFVAPDSTRTNQITVYANTVETEQANLMLLPVPNPTTVEFIDLSKYEDIFKDLETSFKKNTRSRAMLGAYAQANALPVQTVGSYQATLVPTQGQLNNIDQSVFGSIQPNINRLLKEQYQDNMDIPFGYIVCKLKQGSKSYHPFAYKHKMATKKDSTDTILFVPTRHEHGNRVPKMMNALIPETATPEDHEADWDHAIYSVNTDERAGDHIVHNSQVKLKRDLIPFNFGQFKSINKQTIEGFSENRDIIYALA